MAPHGPDQLLAAWPEHVTALATGREGDGDDDGKAEDDTDDEREDEDEHRPSVTDTAGIPQIDTPVRPGPLADDG